MNKEIEIHDTTLSKIKHDGGGVVLLCDKAIVYPSEGEPGVDFSTCWLQTIEMDFGEATIEQTPKILPYDLDYGYLIINGKEYNNMFSLDLTATGEISFVAYTALGDKVRIKAKKFRIKEIGEPEYLQDAPE